MSAAPATGTPKIEPENPDVLPFADRLVFNRIGSLSAPPSNAVHDLITLRLRNSGSGPLTITGLSISGVWAIEPPIALPVDVAAGSALSVRIRFRAEGTAVNFGSLTVASNDPARPSLVVQLAGVWQSLPENNQEPNPLQIRDALGYTLSFLGGETLDQSEGPGAPAGRRGAVGVLAASRRVAARDRASGRGVPHPGQQRRAVLARQGQRVVHPADLPDSRRRPVDVSAQQPDHTRRGDLHTLDHLRPAGRQRVERSAPQ